MATTVIKTPIYLRTADNTLVRLLAIDQEKKIFTFCDLLTGVIDQGELPINAERISFSVSNRRDIVFPDVIEYLINLNIDISCFSHIPEWLCSRLYGKDQVIHQLVETLRYVETLPDVEVKYSEQFKANIITDRNFNDICSTILTHINTFNERLISILRENGFIVKPLDYKHYGWGITIIETKKGLVVFG